VRRLQKNFVGPADDTLPAPLPEGDFWTDFCRDRPADTFVCAFRSLWNEARAASGLDSHPQSPAEQTYQRYQEWLAFHHRRRTFIDRVTVALGYPPATAS
jgi:hypothetical protein